MRVFSGLALGVSILVAAGCSTAPAELHLERAKPIGTRVNTPSAPTTIWILPIADGRNSSDSVGLMGSRLMNARDAIVWCQTAWDELAQSLPGAMKTVDAPAEAPLVVVPSLSKLHIEFLSTTKAATVVLAVEYRRPNQTMQRKIYRGREVAINWFGAISEYEAAFNAALSQCLAAVRRDLQNELTGRSY